MADDFTAKFATLVERLARRTLEGKISWEELGKFFRADVAGREVRVRETEGEVGPDIEVSIYVDGRLAECMSDTDLSRSGAIPSLGGYEHWFPLMADLLSGARRSALKADAAIDDVLAALEDE